MRSIKEDLEEVIRNNKNLDSSKVDINGIVSKVSFVTPIDTNENLVNWEIKKDNGALVILMHSVFFKDERIVLTIKFSLEAEILQVKRSYWK